MLAKGAQAAEDTLVVQMIPVVDTENRALAGDRAPAGDKVFAGDKASAESTSENWGQLAKMDS